MIYLKTSVSILFTFVIFFFSIVCLSEGERQVTKEVLYPLITKKNDAYRLYDNGIDSLAQKSYYALANDNKYTPFDAPMENIVSIIKYIDVNHARAEINELMKTSRFIQFEKAERWCSYILLNDSIFLYLKLNAFYYNVHGTVKNVLRNIDLNFYCGEIKE